MATGFIRTGKRGLFCLFIKDGQHVRAFFAFGARFFFYLTKDRKLAAGVLRAAPEAATLPATLNQVATA